MEWLKRIFSKKKKMDLTEKTLPELKEELSKNDFQWVKGDKMGNIESYRDITSDPNTGMTFVEFSSGGRINLELLQEYMDMFPSSRVDFSNTNQQELVNPNNTSQIPQQSKNTQIATHSQASKTTQTVSAVELEESPIYTLLKKQKENWVNVNITLKLNLPSKSLYNVLISSFDGAENEVIDYVTEGIDIEDIRSALGESISAYYEQSKKSTSQRIERKENNIQEDGE